EARLEHRVEQMVETTGLFVVAVVEGPDHGLDLPAHQMGGHGDDAYRPDGERRQGQAGLTRDEDEVGHDVDRLGGEVEVLDGVLDGHDVRVLGEPGEGVDLDPPAGATRDVVEHHRLADVGDGPEVGDQALLGGTVVIGGHREDG